MSGQSRSKHRPMTGCRWPIAQPRFVKNYRRVIFLGVWLGVQQCLHCGRAFGEGLARLDLTGLAMDCLGGIDEIRPVGVHKLDSGGWHSRLEVLGRRAAAFQGLWGALRLCRTLTWPTPFWSLALRLTLVQILQVASTFSCLGWFGFAGRRQGLSFWPIAPGHTVGGDPHFW